MAGPVMMMPFADLMTVMMMTTTQIHNNTRIGRSRAQKGQGEGGSDQSLHGNVPRFFLR
jgi:hypothetical protein